MTDVDLMTNTTNHHYLLTVIIHHSTIQSNVSCSLCIPYSGKLSREKTFADFAVLELSAKVFSAKFWGRGVLGVGRQANALLKSLSTFTGHTSSCITAPNKVMKQVLDQSNKPGEKRKRGAYEHFTAAFLLAR